MATRSTPESRRRAQFAQTQASMEEDERKRNRPQPEPMKIPKPAAYGSRPRRSYRSGTKAEQASAMVGAAELATLPFGIGLKGLATGFKAGVKGVRRGLVRNPGGTLKTQKIDLGADHAAKLAKKAALNKQREKELRAVRSGLSPGPHPSPPGIMPRHTPPVKPTVRDTRPSKGTGDFFGDPPGATQRRGTLPVTGGKTGVTSKGAPSKGELAKLATEYNKKMALRRARAAPIKGGVTKPASRDAFDDAYNSLVDQVALSKAKLAKLAAEYNKKLPKPRYSTTKRR